MSILIFAYDSDIFIVLCKFMTSVMHLWLLSLLFLPDVFSALISHIPHLEVSLLLYYFSLLPLAASPEFQNRNKTASRWFSACLFGLWLSIFSNELFSCFLLFFSSPWFLSCWLGFFYCSSTIILKYILFFTHLSSYIISIFSVLSKHITCIIIS